MFNYNVNTLNSYDTCIVNAMNMLHTFIECLMLFHNLVGENIWKTNWVCRKIFKKTTDQQRLERVSRHSWKNVLDCWFLQLMADFMAFTPCGFTGAHQPPSWTEPGISPDRSTGAIFWDVH